MAMDGGSVSVASDGTVSGTGLARRMFDRLAAADTTGVFSATGGDRAVAAKRELATMCNAIGPAIVDEVKNADVTVDVPVLATSAYDGLQQLPATFTAFAPTGGPLTDKHLPGTGTIA